MASLILTPSISARRQPRETSIKYTFFRWDDVSCRLICVGERTMYSLIKGYRSKHLVLSFVSYLCKVICFSKLLNTPWLAVLEIKLVYFCSFQFWAWILFNPFLKYFCFQCKRRTTNWIESYRKTATKAKKALRSARSKSESSARCLSW